MMILIIIHHKKFPEFPRFPGFRASDPYAIETASPEAAANTMICLINQASYLLGRQLQQLDQAFLRDGGFTERLYRARQQSRGARGT